jgi:hypothetical protein
MMMMIIIIYDNNNDVELMWKGDSLGRNSEGE